MSNFDAYGGHFSLELVGPLLKKSSADNGINSSDDDSNEIPFYEAGNGLQYIQIAVDNYRISKIIAAGGTVLSGYGKQMFNISFVSLLSTLVSRINSAYMECSQ